MAKRNVGGWKGAVLAVAGLASVVLGQTRAFAAPNGAPGAAPESAPSADVLVNVDRGQPLGVSNMALGVTHTQRSADSWNNPAAVASAKQLLQASTEFHNQHIMGWGAENPEPAPGQFSWSSLDERINLIRQTGGTPVITLCCSPDWMKGGAAGTTDWNRLEVAPRPDHFADFAELSKQVAQRYPDVKYFQVWNELKGFWNDSKNRWDYERYTDLYNQVYDAVKSVRPDAQIGGPYVVMDSEASARTMSHPSKVSGAYGTLDQRPLDVITYWLANKHGAEFVTVDAWLTNKDGKLATDEFTATQKYVDVAAWLRAHTDLPIWWAEWYSTPWGNSAWTHERQNAVMTVSLLQMAKSGVAVPLRWQPQGEQGAAYQGDIESLWSDTRVAGGGQPFPAFSSFKAIRDYFGPNTPLYAPQVSSSEIEALASPTKTLLVNKQPAAVTVSVNGEQLTLGAYEVRVI